MQDLWSNPLSDVYQKPFCSSNSEAYSYSNFRWNNHPYVNEPQQFYSNVSFVSPRHNTLEDTLEAVMRRQAQINQNTLQNLQELKNSLDRIVSHLKNESENEKFFDPITQYGDNEIKDPQMDNDDVEEDRDVHELNVVETLEQDHFNMSCFDNPVEYGLTNFCDFIFCEDSTFGSKVNAWNPIFELLPQEPKMLPLNENVPKVKLKSLPVARRYAHLRSKDDFFVGSPSKLDVLQRGKSLELLNDYKSMMGWNIADKKKMK